MFIFTIIGVAAVAFIIITFVLSVLAVYFCKEGTFDDSKYHGNGSIVRFGKKCICTKSPEW